MIPDRDALEKELIAWIAEWNEDEAAPDIDTDLLGSGLLDSLGFFGFVTYLEEKLLQPFDFEGFDSSEPASIRRVLDHYSSAGSSTVSPHGAQS